MWFWRFKCTFTARVPQKGFLGVIKSCCIKHNKTESDGRLWGSFTSSITYHCKWRWMKGKDVFLNWASSHKPESSLWREREALMPMLPPCLGPVRACRWDATSKFKKTSKLSLATGTTSQNTCRMSVWVWAQNESTEMFFLPSRWRSVLKYVMLAFDDEQQIILRQLE